jgi:hypothetical protein
VWERCYPIRYRSLYILYPNSSDPIRPDTGAYTSRSGMDLIRYRRFDTLSRHASDPIRSDTEAYTSSPGMDPILSDPTPELTPTRSDPIPELIHPLPEWTRSYPTRYRSSYIFFRCGTDPTRSKTGACTSSTGRNPILSGPVPELVQYLLVWNRSYPIRHQSLYILYLHSPDPIRPDTGAYTSFSGMDPIRYRSFDTRFRNVSDPIRSDTEAYTSSPGMDPILSDPIPELMPLLPEWLRSYPIRYRSLCILFRNGPDPIRLDTGAHTISSGVGPILSDPIPEFVHYLPECTRSYTIRCRSLSILSRNGSDPIRSDTRACTPSSGMDPTLSDPTSKLTHLLPKWARPYLTRYRSLYITLRCGSDPIRSEAGACTPSTGMYPILSDPMPKLIHPLPDWIRSYPIRDQSVYPFFRLGSDPIRSHTEACRSSSETGPTLSDPIPELIHYLPVRIRSYPIRSRSLYI